MPKVTTTPTPAPTTAPVGTIIGGQVAASTVALPPGAPPPRLAGNNPDQFVQTGLADKFNGRVVRMSLLPRKYKTGKKANTYALSCEVTIQADDHTLGKEGIVQEYMKVDNLNQWVPSAIDPAWNGSSWVYTPAGGDLNAYLQLHAGSAGFPGNNPADPKETAVLPPDAWRGHFAIPGAQNSRDDFMKGTKYEQFLNQLTLAGYRTQAPHINWADYRQFLVGVYGYWTRIPYEWKGGPPPEGSDQQVGTLCLAQILDLGPISGAGGASVSGAGSFVPAPATLQPTVIPTVPSTPVAPAPAPAQTTLPIPQPAVPVAPVVGTKATDVGLISAAANEILTALAQQRGAAGVQKGEAGVAVFEEINKRGMDGAVALRLMNDNDWISGDERTFGYDPAKGLLVPLA